MVEQLQKEIFEKFNKIVEQNEPKSSSEDIFPMLVDLFHLLADNAGLAKVLIGRNGDAAFVDKLKQVIKEKCFTNARKILNIKNDGEFEYYYYYIISGCIGLFDTWLERGMKESPEEMAEFVKRLIMSGVRVIE